MSEAAGQDTAIEASSRKLRMAGEWPTARIEEVAERVAMGPFGSSIKVETFVPEGVPVISGQHLHGWRVDDSAGFNFITPEHAEKLRNANVRRGDVIFTHRGTIGQVSYIPSSSAYDRYVVSQSQFFLRPDLNKALPEYLVAYFCSPEGQHKLLANTSQVGVPSIAQPVTYLRSIEIPLPPLPEQHAIAHILGTLDDKIELNRKQNETLEAMARALFKAWFVDFEPVRAKIEGRWQRGQSLPGLPAHLYDLFPDRLVESELGEIPEGWEISTVGEHMVNFDAKRVPLSGAERAKRQGPYPYHGAAGVVDYVNDYLFDGIYLLVGEDGSVVQESGLAVTQYVWGKMWVNNHAHVLQGKGTVSTEQLYLHFQFEPVAAYVTGAVQPKLSQGRMNKMPFVFAGEHVCRAFAELVRPWFAKRRSSSDANKTLAALRDTLLPKLISGELRVPDAEAFLKERGL
jgi:type I restriction enzyme S subunit